MQKGKRGQNCVFDIYLKTLTRANVRFSAKQNPISLSLQPNKQTQKRENAKQIPKKKKVKRVDGNFGFSVL